MTESNHLPSLLKKITPHQLNQRGVTEPFEYRSKIDCTYIVNKFKSMNQGTRWVLLIKKTLRKNLMQVYL
jgi:hypothetical protein